MWDVLFATKKQPHWNDLGKKRLQVSFVHMVQFTIKKPSHPNGETFCTTCAGIVFCCGFGDLQVSSLIFMKVGYISISLVQVTLTTHQRCWGFFFGNTGWALRHTCCDLGRSRIFRKNGLLDIHWHLWTRRRSRGTHRWSRMDHQADRIFNILNELDNLETPGRSMTFNDFHPFFQTIYCLVPETNSCAFRWIQP